MLFQKCVPVGTVIAGPPGATQVAKIFPLSELGYWRMRQHIDRDGTGVVSTRFCLFAEK